MSGVTYAGVPFTAPNKGCLLGTTQVTALGTGRMELWYLIAPTVGTANGFPDPAGGATAVWASSGLTEPVPQLQMAQELARLLSGDPAMGVSP